MSINIFFHEGYLMVISELVGSDIQRNPAVSQTSRCFNSFLLGAKNLLVFGMEVFYYKSNETASAEEDNVP